jgi:hypothetical protein
MFLRRCGNSGAEAGDRNGKAEDNPLRMHGSRPFLFDFEFAQNAARGDVQPAE